MSPMFAFTMAGENLALYVLSAIVAVGAGYAFFKWLMKEDEKLVAARKAAGTLAAYLSSYGLNSLSEFLVDFSVGDFEGMAALIADLAKDISKGGVPAIEAELQSTFQTVLADVLKTTSGRAMVAAALADAAQPADPSVVAAAPQATTVAKS